MDDFRGWLKGKKVKIILSGIGWFEGKGRKKGKREIEDREVGEEGGDFDVK